MNFFGKFRLKLALKAKCKVFHQSGYPAVTSQDIEVYLLYYRWRKKPLENIKEMLKDVQSFSTNEFFDYQQIKIQTSESDSSSLKDFSDLF